MKSPGMTLCGLVLGIVSWLSGDFALAEDPAASSKDPPALLKVPFSQEEALKARKAWSEYLKIPEKVKNSVGQEMILIPPGEFLMGSPKKELNRYEDEVSHRVTLTCPFYLGKTETTQGQWEALMEKNPSYFRGTDLPVEEVSWKECVDYCKHLSEREKRANMSYRLPTEAEWEYACRAGTKARYYSGENYEILEDYAWHYLNSDSKTHPVGEKKANGFGLHDMHGNVSEWCQDWNGIYPQSPQTDPQGPSQGSFRVTRGGNWFSHPVDCRSAFHYQRFVPWFRGCFQGFRLTLVPSGARR